MLKRMGFFYGLLCFLSVTACAQDKPGIVKMANPASEKCIQNGYVLEEQKSDLGIPEAFICVNPKNNKRCEEWAYFRRECFLDNGSFTKKQGHLKKR